MVAQQHTVSCPFPRGPEVAIGELYIPHLDPRSDVVDAMFRGRPARFHWVEGPVPQAAIEQGGRVVPFVLTELPFF